MREEILYEMHSIYRDDFRVRGYRFGTGEEALCVVGSMRGNEYQQLYCASLLVRRLKELEEEGMLKEGKEILVIPCVNPASMNIHKRFWAIDNTDINRMWPGYKEGETTQRIAGFVFDAIKDFTYGIQFASFYMEGSFVPHVRIMKTGYEDPVLATDFALPYVVIHEPRPFDTTTLNYNWQIWETKAFSIYTTRTSSIDNVSAEEAVNSILSFMARNGMIEVTALDSHRSYSSRIVSRSALATVRSPEGGFFESLREPYEHVEKNEVIARIRDPYDNHIRCEIMSPVAGRTFFVNGDVITYSNTAVFKIVPDFLRGTRKDGYKVLV